MKFTVATLTVAALVVGGATFTTQAQPVNDDQQRPRLMQRGPGGQPAGLRQGPGGRRGGPGRGFALRGLDLTEAQRAQIKALHEKLRADVQAVLTPEQLATLKARRGRGGD